MACFVTISSLVAGACSSSDSPADPPITPSYCDVAPIIAAKCQRCHAQLPVNGAPFSLASYADTQAPAPSPDAPDRRRYQLMEEAVESGVMPDTKQALDPPVSPLSCAERALLLAWLAADAPPAPADDPNCLNKPAQNPYCSR